MTDKRTKLRNLLGHYERDVVDLHEALKTYFIKPTHQHAQAIEVKRSLLRESRELILEYACPTTS